MHRYIYCQDDPLNNTDPTGRFTLAGTISAVSTAMIFINYGLAAWDAVSFARERTFTSGLSLAMNFVPYVKIGKYIGKARLFRFSAWMGHRFEDLMGVLSKFEANPGNFRIPAERAAYRVPDLVKKGINGAIEAIGECKFVKKLYCTQQLKDFMKYAGETTSETLTLFVRDDTYIAETVIEEAAKLCKLEIVRVPVSLLKKIGWTALNTTKSIARMLAGDDEDDYDMD